MTSRKLSVGLMIGFAVLCALMGATRHAAAPAETSRVIGGGQTATSRARLAAGYGRLPLSFEVNQGQTDRQVKFLSRGRGYTLFLTGNEAVLAFRKPSADTGRRSAFGNSKFETRSSVPEALRVAPYSLLPAFGDSANPLWRPAGLHETFGRRAADLYAKSALREPGDQAPAPGAVHLELLGANSKAKVVGEDELPGKVNYFIGNDPEKWRTNVPTYAKVRYRNIYPGIDLVYYGSPYQTGQLEYDFVVAARADPKKIQLAVAAMSPSPNGGHRPPLQVAADGDLVIGSDSGEVRFHKPVVYQPVAPGFSPAPNRQSQITNRQSVGGRFLLLADNRVAFDLGEYDRTKPLVIDPTLVYSTFLGSSGNYVNGGGAFGLGIAVDPGGNAYVTGGTSSPDFPTTSGAFDTTSNGGELAFVTKLNATGSAVVYSTFLGGGFGDGIVVDPGGNAYVTGATWSPDFPTTSGAFQTAFGGGAADAFVTKLNPTGSTLVYSTFLGSASWLYGFRIAVDSGGNAYVAGFTQGSIPTTAGAFQTTFGGGSEIYVAKLNASGSALVYSTYLGGDATYPGGIALDSAGEAYVTGGTSSRTFPTTPGAFHAVYGGGELDAFVTKLNADGSAPIYSTYLGISSSYGGYAQGIAVDFDGNAYVTGYTEGGLPTTPGALQTELSGFADVFVTKLNPSGSALVYSTYLGGYGAVPFGGIAIDALGNPYIAGRVASNSLPVTSDAFQTSFDLDCYASSFISKLNSNGSALAFSTYLGGACSDSGANDVAVDSGGSAYVAGTTGSRSFATTPGAFQTAAAPNESEAIVVKISFPVATTTSVTASSNPSLLGQSLTLTAAVSSTSGGTPTGTASFSDGSTTLGTFALSSGQAMFTASSLVVGSHAITARYNPDTSSFAPSSGKLTEEIEYGICALYDQTKSVNSGAVFPIKLDLCDVNGNDVSSSGIVVHAVQVTAISGNSGDPETVGNANPDLDFRFDSTLGTTGGYIFNLGTSGLASGTYSLQFTASGDPVTHSVTFGVK